MQHAAAFPYSVIPSGPFCFSGQVTSTEARRLLVIRDGDVGGGVGVWGGGDRLPGEIKRS